MLTAEMLTAEMTPEIFRPPFSLGEPNHLPRCSPPLLVLLPASRMTATIKIVTGAGAGMSFSEGAFELISIEGACAFNAANLTPT
jgi:hypothetical protein